MTARSFTRGLIATFFICGSGLVGSAVFSAASVWLVAAIYLPPIPAGEQPGPGDGMILVFPAMFGLLSGFFVAASMALIGWLKLTGQTNSTVTGNSNEQLRHV